MRIVCRRTTCAVMRGQHAVWQSTQAPNHSAARAFAFAAPRATLCRRFTPAVVFRVVHRYAEAGTASRNFVGAAEDRVRVTPAEKDVLVHLFAQKEGAYWAVPKVRIHPARQAVFDFWHSPERCPLYNAIPRCLARTNETHQPPREFNLAPLWSAFSQLPPRWASATQNSAARIVA